MGWFRVARIAALGFGVGLIGTPAGAGPISPSALVPALGVYVDAIAGDHAAAMACAKPESQVRDQEAWNAAEAIFTATLWANGFPTDFVKGLTARLDAAPAAGPDCADKDTLERIRDPDHEGWPAYLAHALSGMDLKPVFPVTEERWQAIRDAVGAEAALQTRVFRCVAATSPEFLPVAVHDWDEMLDSIGNKLLAAGLPRDEVAATLAGAEANALWQPAPAVGIAALKQDCAKDGAWSDRFFGLKFQALTGTVDTLLPPSGGGD